MSEAVALTLVAVMGLAKVVQAVTLAATLVVNYSWYERPTTEVQLSINVGPDLVAVRICDGAGVMRKTVPSSLSAP